VIGLDQGVTEVGIVYTRELTLIVTLRSIYIFVASLLIQYTIVEQLSLIVFEFTHSVSELTPEGTEITPTFSEYTPNGPELTHLIGLLAEAEIALIK
jgi:hypothetical protein